MYLISVQGWAARTAIIVKTRTRDNRRHLAKNLYKNSARLSAFPFPFAIYNGKSAPPLLRLTMYTASATTSAISKTPPITPNAIAKSLYWTAKMRVGQQEKKRKQKTTKYLCLHMSNPWTRWCIWKRIKYREVISETWQTEGQTIHSKNNK